MYQRKTEPDLRCPLELGMSAFGGKWKSRLICILSLNGRMRYGQLLKSMGNISDPILTSNLKELVEYGLVERVQYNEVPLRVEYSLTAVGESLVPLFHQICQWTHANLKQAGDLPESCMACVQEKMEQQSKKV